LSIPFIVFTSNLLSTLMDRYPIIIYLGAAVLGKVGAQMIFTDPAVTRLIELSPPAMYLIEAAFAIGVIAVGRLWIKWVIRSEEAENTRNDD
jgi:predicted tellurium resistance membrane protein TerC